MVKTLETSIHMVAFISHIAQSLAGNGAKAHFSGSPRRQPPYPWPTVTSSSKPFLIRAGLAFWGFASHSEMYRVVLSCFIRFTLMCHLAMFLKLLVKQSVFLTHGRLSINTCGIELTSLVSFSPARTEMSWEAGANFSIFQTTPH